jgi:CheY-like chemotaxis protein
MVGQLSNRVLVVDDEPLIRKLVCANLVAAGFVVRTAVDGLDALGKLRAGLPDLIISDLNMPRMSGIELLGVVRKRFPQIPVVVISAAPADEIAKEVPADAYYHKNGFGFEQLLQTISDLTGKPPLRTAPLLVDNKAAKARRDGDGHYVVECLDCLRLSRVPGDPKFTRGAHLSTCIHCCGVLQWLFDDGDSREGEGYTIPLTAPTATAA